jgi:ACS family hexuronate transporter-like MFS transporter
MADPRREPSVLDARGVESPGPLRTWGICGLMLLATMLNYMDRQTLAQQASDIRTSLNLSNENYGWLETGFGLAFAVGGIVTGAIADRVSLRWLYPAILLGWSAVGFATGWVTSFAELLACRVLLGLFEAGQWPCALAASQRLLPAQQRPLGNSILQSGASLGAILTPWVILALNRGGHDGWRLPFQVIGAMGVVWIAAWLLAIRPRDLEIQAGSDEGKPEKPPGLDAEFEGPAATEPDRRRFARRFLALMVVVVVINLCWQYFRAWMPMMLEKQYGYSQERTQNFSSLYYFAAGIGCLTVGFLVRQLTFRGWPVHRARMVTFAACVGLTALSVLVPTLPASPALLALFLVIGFGSLGQFPTYYAFTQDLSVRQMGRITGVLSFVTWTVTGLVQVLIGRWIDRTGSYAVPTLLAGVVPAFGLFAMLILWGERTVPAGDDRGPGIDKNQPDDKEQMPDDKIYA